MTAKDYHLSPQTRAVSKLAKTPAVYKQAKITDPPWSLNKGDRGIDMILQEFEILCNKYDEILAQTKGNSTNMLLYTKQERLKYGKT